MDYIEIVLSSDDNYAKYCATTMISILENTKSRIRFHIFDGGIKDYHKNKLLKFENNYNCKIVFYSMDKVDLSDFPLNREWISIATYYRLFITDILADDIEKVIYLDCDVIVNKDILELWKYDISEYLAGAVEDENSIKNHKRLKLSDTHMYFNAGVLLFNLAKLRAFDFKNKSFEYLKNNINKIEMQDQDILNGILENRCLKLPLIFNTNTTMFYPYYKNKHYYTEREAKEALKNNVIIHYTGSFKPWLRPELEQSDYFWKYARLSYFYEEIILSSTISDIAIRTIIKNVHNIHFNYLKYFKYKFLYFITLGNKKRKFKDKSRIYRLKIKDFKKTMG